MRNERSIAGPGVVLADDDLAAHAYLGVPGRAPVIVGTFVSSGQVSNCAGGVAIAAARRDPARAAAAERGGYAVILHDADGVTVVLNEPLMREQSGISP